MKTRRWITALFILIILLTLLQILSVNRFWIESYYSEGIYPVWAGLLTTLTDLLPFSLFEIFAAAVLLYILFTSLRWMVFWLRKKTTFLKAAGHLVLRLATIGLGLYFWFLVSWGLNYHRIPLIDKHGQGFPRAEEKHFVAAARWATMEIIRIYEDPLFGEVEPATASALASLDEVLSRMGEEAPGISVRLKHFLWNYPLDASRTYGMISPFTLELHLSSSLFPVEIPFLAAHEMVHIKGYASEAEANFLAFEACLDSEHPFARFSAFLNMFTHLYVSIPREEQVALLDRWPEGVKEIVKQIQERDQRYSGAFLEGVRTAYDIYLKFHSEREGIRSYSRAGGWIAVMHYSEALAALSGEDRIEGGDER